MGEINGYQTSPRRAFQTRPGTKTQCVVRAWDKPQFCAGRRGAMQSFGMAGRNVPIGRATNQQYGRCGLPNGFVWRGQFKVLSILGPGVKECRFKHGPIDEFVETHQRHAVVGDFLECVK